jgi:hypothetical protein
MKLWLFNPYGPIPEEGWREYRFAIVGKQPAKRGFFLAEFAEAMFGLIF